MSANWWEIGKPVQEIDTVSAKGSIAESDTEDKAKRNWWEIGRPVEEPAQTEAAPVRPAPTTPGQGAGMSFQDLFGAPVTPELAASYKAVSEPPLQAVYGELERQAIEEGKTSNVLVGGVSATQDILGNLLEGTSRIPSAIPETAYTSSPILGGIKAGVTAVAPKLQSAAERFKKESEKVNFSTETQLKDLADNPLNVVPFVLERFAVSIPYMAASYYAAPALIVSLTNKNLNERLKNDGRNFEDATVADVAAAGASAVLQSKLEKFATARFGRAETVLGETAVQSGTEAIQDIGQYVAQTAGTKAGFDPTTAGLIGLEAGIAGGGIGLTFAGAQDFAQRRIEARVRGNEELGSQIENNILDELRNQAFEKAKSISAPELNKIPIGAGQTEATPVQYGDAYAQKIYDTIGNYIPVNAEFKVEEKTIDGAPKFIVTDKTGTQYGQDLDSRDRADSLSLSLNNTTRGRAEVIKQLEPLQSSLSDALKGFGLNDVGLSINNRVFTRRGEALTSEGLFDPVVRRVFLAVDAVDPQGNLDTNQRREALRGVLRHEVVHALRYLDLWKRSEWKNLEGAASNLKKPGTDKTYLQIAQENYADQNKVIQVEESVADLIRDVAGNISRVAGKPRNLSERAINFFDKTKNSLTGAGFQTYEDVIRRFEQGVVGARERGRIRTFRATEERLAEQGRLPDRVQRLFATPQDRNQFRQETVQKVQQETPAVTVPAINSLRLNAVRESRSTIDPVPPKITVDEQEVPTRDSEGRLIYSGFEGPEVFNTPTRPTMDGLRNFWNWFGSSKAVDNNKRPLVYYHGTAADITAFQPKQAGSVFLTRSPRFAEEFSALSEDYMVSNFPDFMSDQQVLDAVNETLQSVSSFTPAVYDKMAAARDQAAEDIANGKAIRPAALKVFKSSASTFSGNRYLNAIQKRIPSSPNVMPVYVRAEKPWDYNNPSDIKAVVKRARDNGADITASMVEEIGQGNWQTIEGSDGNAPILDAIRELGYDSMFVEEGGQKNLAVFDPGQIKSAIGNNGDFSPLTPSIRESRRSPNVVGLMSGEEVPPRKLKGKTQVAQYLQDRALEALGGRTRDLNNETDRDAIADDLVEEAIYEMEAQKNALEWYDTTIERTIELLSLKYPEIKTDQNARTAFLTGLAITSQNIAVPDNLKYAEEVYNYFKRNRRFPEKGFGSKAGSIKRNFEKANMLIDSLGSMEAFTDFLQTEFTVGQLNPILKEHLGKGAKVGGELVGAKVYGSAVFGPKIGNGFYTNLRGDFSPVTIDMWFMRTIGRLRGKVMDFEEAKFGKQLNRLAKSENMEGASTDELVARATQLAKQHEKDFKQFRSEYDSGVRKKSEATNAAITIVKSLKATRDAPSTGREREQLRDIVNRAINKMRDRTGQDIPPAAFQALIWYPEQDLYKKLGVNLKHVRQDYANSTKQFLRNEGFSERELKRSEDRVRSRRQRRTERVRPGAVAPVEAAVAPTGRRIGEAVPGAEAAPLIRESRRPQAQLDQAVANAEAARPPAAREARRRGTPIGPTQPGPTNDTDNTSAAEALNGGQPVDSIGTPSGPTISDTEPDGTVDISGARIAPLTRRLVVQMIQSAPDKLRSGIGLDDLAKRVENYYDTYASRLGVANGIIRDAFKRIDFGGKTAALTTFEEFIRARENGRTDDAQSILDMATDSERQLIDAWNEIARQTGEINTSIRTPDGKPMRVWDAKRNEWRPIRSVRNFFPRTFRREVMEVMQNPDLDPVLWQSLLDSLVEAGIAETTKGAEKYLLREWFSDEVAQDYFAGVEKARTEPLPEIFYDYSWDAATRYLRKWSRRTAQIENFGQTIGKFQKEWFDKNIPKVRDQETQNYLNSIKERVYEIEQFNALTNMSNWANSLATATQLGNPVSASLNLLGGTITNVQEFGIKEIAKSYANLVLDWKNVQNEGTTLGILNKDFMNILNDHVEMDADKYFSKEQKISQALAKFSNFMLTIGGFNGAENIVRSSAMLAARSRLNSFLNDVRSGSENDAVKRFREWIKRENLDVDALILEDGAGKETERFMRRAVNVPQGSYSIDMTPVFIDSAAGRFLLKYQKFGTQVNRFFYNHFLKVFYDNPTPRNFMRVAGFVGSAIIGGGAIIAIREAFGYGDPGPDDEEIKKAFEKEDTARAWSLIFSRAWQNIMTAGSLGFFANYAQFAKDWQDQQRVKNPFSPPGLASVDAVIDVFNRLRDQGKLTARDLDEIAETTLSFYRANKRIGLAAMDAMGSDAREVRRFAAQKEIREVREYGRRYSEAMDIEFKQRTAPGTIARTPMTPVNKAITDALQQGDAARARLLVREAIRGLRGEERDRVEASIRASVRNRQPIQIGGSAPSQQELQAFMRWSRQNLPAEKYQMIRRADMRYRRAASRAGVGIGG